MTSIRRTNFEETFDEVDETALKKHINFDEHRFVSVEKDSITGSTLLQGHRTLRGACGHLKRAVEECERFVPECVVDLDTGQEHQLDVFVFVAPKSVEAVAVLLPRALVTEMTKRLLNSDRPEGAPNIESGILAMQQAIDRSRR